MENEELDNELVVSDDVPETSEQNLEEVNISTSEDGEQIQETTEDVVPSQDDIDARIEARANELMEEKIKDRLARDRASQERKFSKELSKYKHLESIMKAGLGVETLDETINKSSEFYKGQGVNIPVYQEESSYSERDEKILAEADAREIIALGKAEMETEANRIASIPENKRTVREKTVFNRVCKELINLRDIDALKAKGFKTELLNEKSFIDFKNQFNVNTPIENIVNMYNQMNAPKVEKPASAGSAKSENRQAVETFTPEKINSMTPQEISKHWNNPAFRKVAGLN